MKHINVQDQPVVISAILGDVKYLTIKRFDLVFKIDKII